jgi:methylenetetrahydrofolate reductase (NADPH)
MAYRQEEAVGEIIQQSGVLEGRVPWYPGCEIQSSYA